MIVESWLNEVTDNKSRGTVFSLYSAINMAASTVGQLAMSATGVVGYLPFVLGAISFICALLPTALTSKPQPRPLQSAKLDLPLLYRTSPGGGRSRRFRSAWPTALSARWRRSMATVCTSTPPASPT